MRTEQGTDRKARIWLEKQKAKPDDEVVLWAIVAGMRSSLGRWAPLEACADTGWETHVFELAQSFADERNTTTDYELALMRGDEQRSFYPMRRTSTRTQPEQAKQFDGSPTMLVQGLYDQNKQLMGNLMSSQNSAVGPLTKALDFANARIGTLEKERSDYADKCFKQAARISELELELAKKDSVVDEAHFDKIEERLMKLWMMAKSSGMLTQGQENKS